MEDFVGSLVARAFRAATAGLMPCATLLFLLCAATASAQIPQPVVTPAPKEPEFLSRYDFHLTATALAAAATVPEDQRFSWFTHFGGSVDVVDYVSGRAALIIDYEAVLGSEYRPFDPNQGNYTLEGSLSGRVGETEVVGIFHHVSRHLSDRPKRFAIAWNELGARVLRRVALSGLTVDLAAEAGRLVQHSYVDYTWVGELNVLVRRPINEKVGMFAHGTGQTFGVDSTVANRGTQVGGSIEAGVRVNGRGGALEMFAGIEKRVDADPIDRQPHHWGLAGFRLLSR